MNIEQLESYSLAEAAKLKDTLNPVLWSRHEHLKNAVKDQILVGAEEYCQYLGLTESKIKDIVISGENAGYMYNNKSTVDVVIIADINNDPVFRELFNEHNSKFKAQHTIKLKEHTVKFYVYPADSAFVTYGSYSVLKENWIRVAARTMPKSKDTVALLKEQELANKPKVVAVKKKKPVKEQKPFVYGYGRDFIAEVEITPDGTNPSTCQFTNEADEPSDEDILRDFIDFCFKELKLEEMPIIKLRKDPQWPVTHKTFGRYTNDKHMLEVAWGHRHIMDVLRTTGHELVHKHQHERDGESMGPEAGETGSKWENEANARAGILMRDYARLHPEYFAVGQAQGLHEDKESNPWKGIGFDLRSDILWPAKMFEDADPIKFSSWISKYKKSLVKPQKHSKCILAMPTQISEHSINIFYGSAIFEGETDSTYLLTIDSGTHEYSKNNQMLFASKNDFDKFELMLKLKFSDYDISIKNMAVQESKLHEASGYIPTAAEAHDPRFEMALSVDIRPGALGKAANALLLNTDAQGHPQELRPDGFVNRMLSEWQQYSKTNTAKKR